MKKYVLTQLDGEDNLIDKNEFENIPTFEQFSNVAYYVDRTETKGAYKELLGSIGDWVYVRAVDEDGFGEFYVAEGVWFLLEIKE
jgi:hypothetical protein